MSVSGIGSPQDFYVKRFMRHGSSPAYSGYQNKNEQMKTYQNTCNLLLKSKKKVFSVLEVGCGFGAFYEYLIKFAKQTSLTIDYLGIDINQKAADMATLKHGELFLNQDLFKLQWPHSFDFVVCLGMMGLNNEFKVYINEMAKWSHNIIFEVFRSHPFLKELQYTDQVPLISGFPGKVGFRAQMHSIIWNVEKSPIN